ncbi:hypothetical protein QM855_04710 [Streptococcus infantis]|uniref:hypothetical protein n=1 Tax=Streptococcus infantis TaxID=68892 RepID=UPI0039C4841C
MKIDENMKVFENFKVKTLNSEDVYCYVNEKNSKNNQKIKNSKIFSAKRLTYFLNVIE